MSEKSVLHPGVIWLPLLLEAMAQRYDYDVAFIPAPNIDTPARWSG